ncbi:MAG TPA: hypothetical protein V6C71_00050 [Coleofasciculaceae cyanobacterium]|jgi:hypothetical protein
MKIDKSDRPQVKAECLRLMVTLQLDPARMQLISGFVDTYLNLNPKEEANFQSQLSTIKLEQQEQIMEITLLLVGNVKVLPKVKAVLF